MEIVVYYYNVEKCRFVVISSKKIKIYFKKEDTIMERILEILSSIRADIDFEKEEKLIDDGILDSFDIVSIVAELCAEYDVTITVDMLEPENFNSAAAMLALVESILDED